MASPDSNSSPCMIVRRSCTLRPQCSECETECLACRCYRCDTHDFTYRICRDCYSIIKTDAETRIGAGWLLDWSQVATEWCRMQRARNDQLADERF